MAYHDKYGSVPYDYIVPIRAGGHDIAGNQDELSDSTGLNISDRNEIYSELSVLYWLWQNTDDDYIGLCHYRRFLSIDEKKIIEKLSEGCVIVPSIAYLGRSMENQFLFNHVSEVWDAMMLVLKKKNPVFHDFARKRLDENRMYPFNMMICGREFLDDYCKWLFDILFEVENLLTGLDLDDYQMRYGGFLAERLLTLYLMFNETKVHEVPVVNERGNLVSQSALKKLLNNTYYNLFDRLK